MDPFSIFWCDWFSWIYEFEACKQRKEDKLRNEINTQFGPGRSSSLSLNEVIPFIPWKGGNTRRRQKQRRQCIGSLRHKTSGQRKTRRRKY